MSEKFTPAKSAEDFLDQADAAKKAAEAADFWKAQLGDEVINGDRDSEESQQRIDDANAYARHLEGLSERGDDYDLVNEDEGVERNNLANKSLAKLTEAAKKAQASGNEQASLILQDVIQDKIAKLVDEGKLSEEAALNQIDLIGRSITGETGAVGEDAKVKPSKGFEGRKKPEVHVIFTEDDEILDGDNEKASEAAFATEAKAIAEEIAHEGEVEAGEPTPPAPETLAPEEEANPNDQERDDDSDEAELADVAKDAAEQAVIDARHEEALEDNEARNAAETTEDDTAQPENKESKKRSFFQKARLLGRKARYLFFKGKKGLRDRITAPVEVDNDDESDNDTPSNRGGGKRLLDKVRDRVASKPEDYSADTSDNDKKDSRTKRATAKLKTAKDKLRDRVASRPEKKERNIVSANALLVEQYAQAMAQANAKAETEAPDDEAAQNAIKNKEITDAFKRMEQFLQEAGYSAEQAKKEAATAAAEYELLDNKNLKNGRMRLFIIEQGAIEDADLRAETYNATLNTAVEEGVFANFEEAEAAYDAAVADYNERAGSETEEESENGSQTQTAA